MKMLANFKFGGLVQFANFAKFSLWPNLIDTVQFTGNAAERVHNNI